MSGKPTAIATLTVLTISLLATSAGAHPKLTSASPAADVSSKVSPTEIKLNFSEGVIAKFSGLALKDEAGTTITTGLPANDPQDPKRLVVQLPAPLKAGHYTVTWYAVSEDTHRVKGEYSFGVDR
ncbi:MAG: copper homeostasis periplasmic binding protein CopC [Xanthobacteraceae bacterium]|nr:copper homeostasis periplasmic binding protein CopC [Xanthobacteraceae bacterium]